MSDLRSHFVRKLCWAFFLLIITVAVGCSTKPSIITLVDGQQAMKVRGKVKIVEPDIGMLILKARNATTTISFNDKVARRGFASMAELKVGNPLEVVYLQDNLGNYALSIEKLAKGS